MPPRKPKPLKASTTKAAKPWDPRPHPGPGSSEDDTYKAVGKALTNCEHIEVALADIFTIAVGAPETGLPSAPSTRAYGSILAFNSRLEMVWAAVETFLNPIHGEIDVLANFRANTLTIFDQLTDEIGCFAARRNEIAHGQVFGTSPNFYTPFTSQPENPLD